MEDTSAATMHHGTRIRPTKSGNTHVHQKNDAIMHGVSIADRECDARMRGVAIAERDVAMGMKGKSVEFLKDERPLAKKIGKTDKVSANAKIKE